MYVDSKILKPNMAKENKTMKHTKIMIAAAAVLFAIMPVTVHARHTEDTYYMQYQEGQELGSLTYAGDTYSVLYGITQETVNAGNVELFGLSAPDHLIMLAHSDKAFSNLYNTSQIGAKINVVINGDSSWYEVFNAYWIDQTTWENEDNLYNLYYTDTTPLTLVTCNHHGATRGRWVVQCAYSTEPVQENVANLPPIPDTNETIEEVVEIAVVKETFKPIEETPAYENEAEIEMVVTIEEPPVSTVTRLDIMRMKRIYVSRRIELNRGL